MPTPFFRTIWLLTVFAGIAGLVSGQPPRAEWLTPAHTASLYYLYDRIDSDSATWYARLAESRAGGHADRLAYARLLRAEIRGRLLGDAAGMAEACRQAMGEHELSPGTHVTSMAHRLLGTALALAGRKAEALLHLDTALQLAHQLHDPGLTGWTHQAIGFTHAKSGQYWEAFTHLSESLDIGRSTQDTLLTALSLTFLARLYHHAGDPATAIRYYRAFEALPPPRITALWPHFEDLAYACLKLGMHDSALFYRGLQEQLLAAATSDPQVRRIAFARLSPHFPAVCPDQPPDTLTHHLALLQNATTTGHTQDRLHVLLLLARSADSRGDTRNAIHHATGLRAVSEQAGNLYFQKEAAGLLAAAYDRLGRTDSAYANYRLLVSLRDSLQESLFGLRAAHYASARKAEAAIRDLQTENRRQRHTRLLLIVGILLVSLAGALAYRSILLQRRNEKLRFHQQQASLQKQALELEMKALRAQMNPHFIFNSLSAIDNLVQQGQTDRATRYLSKFARLIRAVLDSSRKNLVPFQQDMDTMYLYLEMEQFRCNYTFTYTVEVDEALSRGDYKVPPLIIQPFLENAIHHGLLNKAEGDRVVHITASIRDTYLEYHITDNGIGLAQSAALNQVNKPGHESYGIAITRERLQLHNRRPADDDMHIMDIAAAGAHAGTRAVVRILLDP